MQQVRYDNLFHTQFFGDAVGQPKPSLPFVFGWQDDIRYEAGRRGWLTDFADFNEQFIRSTNKTLNLTASLQPANDLQIDLKADHGRGGAGPWTAPAG